MSIHNLANMKEHNSRHKENTPTRLRLDELGVHDLDSCILEFDCDPFDPENTRLRTLQSGEFAPEELVEDLLSAPMMEKQSHVSFLRKKYSKELRNGESIKTIEKRFLIHLFQTNHQRPNVILPKWKTKQCHT